MAAAGPTYAAAATAPGGQLTLLRLSGPAAFTMATRAGLDGDTWQLPDGPCPVRVLARRGPRTATGHDLIEILLPGAPDLTELALAQLQAVGAEPAPAGAFTRQAVATGRLSLDQGEAILAVAQASDAQSAAAALTRLRGALAEDLVPVRADLLALRARIEAGLDFLDEHDVGTYDRQAVGHQLAALDARLARWQVAVQSTEIAPIICLVGAPNAGKSALYAALSGEPALISPIAGTTRDVLEARIDLAGSAIRLIDTPGWLTDLASADLDHEADRRGRDLLAQATLIIACAAPDAPLPDPLPQLVDPARLVVIATKSDLGLPPDPRAAVAVSTWDKSGLDALRGLLARRALPSAAGEPRQQRLLANARTCLARAAGLPSDEFLADDLRAAAQHLGDILGQTTPDAVLDAIFARFCIGK
jgi:tRNA modification GTPase